MGRLLTRVNSNHNMSSVFSFSYFEETSTNLATFFFQSPSLPTSPSAPLGRAPHSPKQATKKLGRHIAMKEPSECGLFTVCEIPETEREFQRHEAIDVESLANEGSIYSCPSAIASSEALCLTPGRNELEFSEDAYNGSMITDADVTILQTPSPESNRRLHRLSWSSTGSDERPVVTPLMDLENEDPFLCWSHVPSNDGKNDDDFEMAMADVSGTIPQSLFTTSPSLPDNKAFSRARRAPPPLTLNTRFNLPQSSTTSSAVTPTLSAHPVSSASTTASSEILTPRSISSTTSSNLMPPLPIMSSNDWATKFRKAEDIEIKVVTPTTPTSIRDHNSFTDSHQSPISENIDLVSALEDLLSSCGEAAATDSFSCASHDGEFETKPLQFPLPTNRSDLLSPGGSLHTPEKKSKCPSAPYAPRKPSRPHPHSQIPLRREEGRISPRSLAGDHSFLAYLSRSESPASGKWSVKSDFSHSSLGSCSTGNGSSRKLPERMALPVEWFGLIV